MRRDKDNCEAIKAKTMRAVYELLVKHLGTPPTQFSWSFSRGEETVISPNLTPSKFSNIIFHTHKPRDWVLLTDLPNYAAPGLFRVRMARNTQEGEDMTFLNLSNQDLARYVKKSLTKGICVWFAGDVKKGFDWWNGTLDEQVSDPTSLFAPLPETSKSEKLLLKMTEGCHAMNFVGMTLDKHHQPEAWQVENSWGYFDHTIQGRDGFLHMSHAWFKDNVMSVAVLKTLLDKKHRQLLTAKPTELDPWEVGGAALFVKGVKRPIIT